MTRPRREAPSAGPMRVQRAIARAGLASRREADALVAEGRVRVNGTVAAVGQVVDPAHDVLTIDGKTVPPPVTRHTWLVLHKPAGVMTTRRDPQGRRTVFDLLRDVPASLTYVGRLDYLTEGVLLLTTDGDAAHALTHPSREIERTYVATVRGPVGAAVRALRTGLTLEDGPVQVVDVEAEQLGDRRWALSLTLTEGRNREVRRICEALDLAVERLVRTRFGPVTLGALPSGASRPVSPKERTVLDAVARRPAP
ncbi:MAG: rRNA pseudouridine synthase [Gemmatimonadaceae bacterium]|nr:rRNA pseudouridine synthase [Gemmatimonadaceae bacterium]